MRDLRLYVTTLCALLGITGVGVAGYYFIEGYSLLDAVYMTVTTLSTVGFREVHPLSPAGQIFTVFLITTGFGMVLTIVSLWAQRILAGELNAILSKRRFVRMLDKMKDHYILCGYGHFGSRVAQEFSALGIPFVVIDSQGGAPEAVPSIRGDATDEDVLRQAGIERAKGLLTTFSAVADGVYAVLTARELNPGLVIVARAESPAGARRLSRAGATRTVSTYDIGGHRMAHVALNPRVIDFVDMMTDAGQRHMSVVEVAIARGSPWVGKRLSELELERGRQVVVLGVVPQRGHIELGTDSERLLAVGDLLLVFGDQPALERIIHEAGASEVAR